MCAPAIGLVAGLAGSAVSAMGAMQSANAQARSDEYNATVAKINARSERQQGYASQEQIGAKADKVQSQGIAAAAKGGVDPSYGSAAMVIFGEGAETESRDKANTYTNAEGRAIGEENKAKAYEMSAENHRKAGKIAAMGTFLGGIGGAAKSFAGGNNNSLFLNG
jgi:hypothetical protein